MQKTTAVSIKPAMRDPEALSMAGLLMTLVLTNLAAVWVAVNYVA
jgi:hypothetical protein